MRWCGSGGGVVVVGMVGVVVVVVGGGDVGAGFGVEELGTAYVATAAAELWLENLVVEYV